jgi:hypothetical protein
MASEDRKRGWAAGDKRGQERLSLKHSHERELLTAGSRTRLQLSHHIQGRDKGGEARFHLRTGVRMLWDSKV